MKRMAAYVSSMKMEEDRLLPAFERNLLALLPRLRRFARSLARDAADSDDLLQVALERALKAKDQWQTGTNMDAWMMRIVRNCWIDEVRSRTRRARTFAPEEAGEGAGVAAHEARRWATSTRR
jgi:RNA polymerase sigma-70 factor (ECF subfamily)